MSHRRLVHGIYWQRLTCRQKAFSWWGFSWNTLVLVLQNQHDSKGRIRLRITLNRLKQFRNFSCLKVLWRSYLNHMFKLRSSVLANRNHTDTLVPALRINQFKIRATSNWTGTFQIIIYSFIKLQFQRFHRKHRLGPGWSDSLTPQLPWRRFAKTA